MLLSVAALLKFCVFSNSQWDGLLFVCVLLQVCSGFFSHRPSGVCASRFSEASHSPCSSQRHRSPSTSNASPNTPTCLLCPLLRSIQSIFISKIRQYENAMIIYFCKMRLPLNMVADEFCQQRMAPEDG